MNKIEFNRLKNDLANDTFDALKDHFKNPDFSENTFKTMLKWDLNEMTKAVSSTSDTDTLVSELAKTFPSFGGGKVNDSNPLSIWMKDKPPMFAAGVDIEQVVRFILEKTATYKL